MGLARTWEAGSRPGERAAPRLWPIVVALVPWLALAGIVSGALVLRLWAIEWRLPYTMNVDEPVVMDQASGIVLTGDLNPHRFVYPSLQIYLQAAIDWAHLQWGLANGLYHSAQDLPENSHVITTAPGFYVWGRAGTAVLGALAVLFTGLAGRWLNGWRVGLVAALLLAVAPLHVGHSRYVTPDVPASTFAALALLGAVAVYRQSPHLGPWPRRGLYALAGAAVGLATATKYNAVTIAACLLVAHLLARPPRQWLRSADLWLAGAAALAVFFLVTPFALLDRRTFLTDIASIIHHYKYLGHPGSESDQNWWWYLRWLLRNETWLIVPALAGAVWSALRHRGDDLLLLVFPLLSYAGLAGYIVHFERNLLPLFPFLALFAARFLTDAADWLTERIPRARPAALPLTLLLGALLALPPGRAAAETAAYLTRPDSRVAAVAWLTAHVPPGALVLADLEPHLWGGTPTIHSAELVAKPHDHPLEWFSARGYQYLVTNEDRYDKYIAARARYAAQAAAYDRIFAEATELARFGDTDDYLGPEIRIFRLETPPERLAIGRRLDARLGSIAVLGATVQPVARLDDIAVQGAPAPALRPGGIVGVTLYFRPTAPLDTDYTVFVHVVNEQGQPIAQRDTEPHGGAQPTSTWSPGTVIVDPANVPLPPTTPPGTYRVVIGLYTAPDGPRLPAAPAQPDRPDSLEIGTIVVRR
ncbi:MAG: glycosyltransferase family 39 protein [Chloroflexi bacterium]|nr:glycosyltransferase family 39 protein [Chloroflexota bacterium]